MRLSATAEAIDDPVRQLRIARDLKQVYRNIEKGDRRRKDGTVDSHPAEGQKTVSVVVPDIQHRQDSQYDDHGADREIQELFAAVALFECPLDGVKPGCFHL